MQINEIRRKYLDYLNNHGHVIVASGSLVPEDDPTTLFTGSGMQPMLQYLLGKEHPEGTRIADSQKCFRAMDIDEVGDNRHTTFFEMLGNWSLGDYWKQEQLTWFWEFLTKELNLSSGKLYVTLFEGNKNIPKDTDSVKIWKKLGVQEDHIFFYPATKNWWSRAGIPDNMPIGEPGGPTSEVFYDFGTAHDNEFGSKCHPNCDCGRFLEIGNSVFMTYKKIEAGLEKLPKKNVDFGGGLERLVAAVENQPDMFKTTTFKPIIDEIVSVTDRDYEQNKVAMRIIADHLRAATFLIEDGVVPSNKDQGYVLRQLIRRSIVKMRSLGLDVRSPGKIISICKQVIKMYDESPYFSKPEKSEKNITDLITKEVVQFSSTLTKGLKMIDQTPAERITSEFVFDLYQSYGFPFEITEELLSERKIKISKADFDKALTKHREISKKGATKRFAGGLADHNEETIKLHTATHLLHYALREILGEHVQQKGSNITAERLRFDFSHSQTLSEDELKQIEELVNSKIKGNFDVWSEILDKKDAEKLKAMAFFGEKYGDKVNVYFIGNKGKEAEAFSKEFCGGPHVEHTGELGTFKIIKEQSAGSGIRRIYATLSKK
ncbi:alanine--tRNA ligase [Candidatus Roizmanbacteria bacterium CG_4_9_14_0_2_um_filter_38_17]|nr:alanine--tRNA ligase [Candidatus Microgenomates bacterium]PJC31921.1 MAG: alanine--tRNA ligase [Candidatus Roizmanbacteria bacterium CG_4_9_14_0_2_um_filter_38_17]